MKASVNIDVSENVQNLLKEFSDMQKNRYEKMEKSASEDDDKLCFRICTASGTRINIPSNILRDTLIAGAIFMGVKIAVDLVEIIVKK